jgi:hypothetical protein
MALILVLALQAAAPAPAPATPRWAMIAPPAGEAGLPDDFNLAVYAPSPDPRCLGAGGEEVVVCGRRGGAGAYPMDRWARIFGPEAPIRAEMGLGGNVQGRVYTEAAAMPRGAVANRVLVGIRMPF